ncbi:hypothetical protein PENTCL1PPCAC_14275, partial [Pristionchus entomophagus]
SSLFLETRYEDFFHFLTVLTLDGTAIAINGILIITIIRSTPSSLKSYSALLLFSAIIDGNAALMSLLATVTVNNLEGSIIFVYLGPCRFIHVQMCYAAQAIHVQSISQSCVALILSFSYRLWSFAHTINHGVHSESFAKLFCLCLLSTIPAAITTITFSNSPSLPPQSLIEHPQLAGRLFSVFNMSASHLLSTENLLPRVSIGYIICLYLTASPILFILRRKLLQKIQIMTSSSEKRRHHQIFRSLTLQMCIPLSFSIAFVFWILDFIGVYRLDVFQRAVMPISSLFAIISPLIVIYYLPPYRRY